MEKEAPQNHTKHSNTGVAGNNIGASNLNSTITSTAAPAASANNYYNNSNNHGTNITNNAIPKLKF